MIRLGAPTKLPAVVEQTAARKSQTLAAVTRVTFYALAAGLLLAVWARRLVLDFPTLPVILSLVGYAVVLLLVQGLLRRGATEWGARVYLIGGGVALLALCYFMGGPAGPITLAFGPLIVIGALVSGPGAALGSTLGVGGVMAVWLVLQGRGLATPYPLPASADRILTLGMLFLSLGTMVALLAIFVRLIEESLVSAYQRGEELSEALERAETAAQAEVGAREQIQETLEQLQASVQEYTTFLSRIEEGDFEARLDMEELAKRIENPALLALGSRLTRTVETLITTLNELRSVQQRYLREAWTMFLESGSGRRGFSAHGGEVQAVPPAWNPPMLKATQGRRTVVEGGELAVPIAVRDEVIGALSARRTDGSPWTAEDLALVESVMDQLGQTLETLRLVEETQRQAQRQQVLSDLSGRFSRSFDVDALLQQAIMDLGRILDLDEVAVFLEPVTAAGEAPANAPAAGAEEMPDAA